MTLPSVYDSFSGTKVGGDPEKWLHKPPPVQVSFIKCDDIIKDRHVGAIVRFGALLIRTVPQIGSPGLNNSFHRDGLTRWRTQRHFVTDNQTYLNTARSCQTVEPAPVLRPLVPNWRTASWCDLLALILSLPLFVFSSRFEEEEEEDDDGGLLHLKSCATV